MNNCPWCGTEANAMGGWKCGTYTRSNGKLFQSFCCMERTIVKLTALNADLLARVKILEKWGVLARMQLVNADSEFSAVAHGRPSSDKAALLEMSSQCRKLYDDRTEGER